MSFMRKLLSVGGCARLSEDVDRHESHEDVISEQQEKSEDSGLLIKSREPFSDNSSDYVPGAWITPSLGRRMVESVRNSPRLARRAMNKMTSPLVMRKRKSAEIYIVTMHVVHSSGVVGRGEDGRADAW